MPIAAARTAQDLHREDALERLLPRGAAAAPRSALAGSSAGAGCSSGAGYKGQPANGTMEMGYGFVRDQRRRVIAETLPELAPSIGVLRKCGFRLLGDGSEPGVIGFELMRGLFRTGGTMPGASSSSS